MHTLHCTHIKSHLLKKKKRPLWQVMIDDSASTHKRRRSVKFYKNVLPQKRIVVAKVCGETYSKKMKKHGVEKRPQT